MRHYVNRSKMISQKTMTGVLCILFLVVGILPALSVETTTTPTTQNRLLTLTAIPGDGIFSVQLVADKDIGTNFSVYDVVAPDRVVIDLQGMDVTAVAPVTAMSGSPVTEVRSSALELNSGKLGRIELLLSAPAPYTFSTTGKALTVVFDGKWTKTTDTASKDPSGVQASAESVKPTENVAIAPAATKILSIDRLSNGVFLRSDGVVKQFESMTLKNPARFVVDCYGVKAGFKGQAEKLTGAISKVRIGSYPDKVRFVFEGDAKAVAKAVVFPVDGGLKIQWDGKAPSEGGKPAAAAAEYQQKNRPGTLVVDKVDFKVENGKSLVIIELSKPGQVMQPIKDKSLIRFGVRNATISPPLRRTLDASAFPSSVRQVTPYLVSTKGKTDVRFAVELKGDVPYKFLSKGSVLILEVENGNFTGSRDKGTETLSVVSSSSAEKTMAGSGRDITPGSPTIKDSKVVDIPVVTDEIVKDVAPQKKYTGQIVSLNFDNVEIRNLLLLIAEVSDRNIIASEDVKGTITLRLNNVPWDQALEVIMQIRGLGMKEEGNIIRVMPLEKLRAMDLEALKSVSEGEKLEPLSTESFTINYTGLDNIVTPVKDLLSPRGKIYKDNRSKKVFVTDISTVFDKVRKLIAELDTPERQVMIEARIVEANSSFSRDLGVSWGVKRTNTASGALDLDTTLISGGGGFTIPAATGTGSSFVSSTGLSAGFTFGRLSDSTILDLKLAALEASDNGKIVASPRITTLNGQEAIISQGTQIPYQSSGSEGPKTEFVSADLELKVTPVINPDKSMLLTIEASNDSVGSTVSTGSGSAPAINTKKAETKVLVKNGETTVIGGIFIETENESEAGIPILRSIPILGHLFKSTNKSKKKSELLIFITPRILE